MIGLTNIGLKRLTNQDYICILKNSSKDTIGILCDGIGGHNSGEVASSTVVEYFVEEFKKLPKNFSKEDYVQWLKEHIQKCNDLIITLSKSDIKYSDMGTTLVLTILTSKDIIIANVGDSRAYVVNNDSIRQLSEDHTYVNMKVKLGELSLIEAQNHPSRNVVMQAIGIEQELFPHIVSLNRDNIKSVVLFSDGVTDYVNDNFIKEVLIDKNNLNEVKGKIIIEKALEEGGKDNISLVILDLEEWNVNE